MARHRERFEAKVAMAEALIREEDERMKLSPEDRVRLCNYLRAKRDVFHAQSELQDLPDGERTASQEMGDFLGRMADQLESD